MATAQEKVLENIDKVAMSNYSPYEKVLAIVSTEYNNADSTLSAGGTYDGMKTIPNPLGYKALPVTLRRWAYHGFLNLWMPDDDDRTKIELIPLGGLNDNLTVTVTDTEIRLYYTDVFPPYGDIYKVKIFLMEI